jgi:hypothetical protein
MTVEPDLSVSGHPEVLAVGDMALRVRGRDGSAVASGQEVKSSAAVSSGRSAAPAPAASIWCGKERAQRAGLLELGHAGVVELDAGLVAEPGQLVLEALQMVK